MPKMYLYTLRKADGSLAYVLRPIEGTEAPDVIAPGHNSPLHVEAEEEVCTTTEENLSADKEESGDSEEEEEETNEEETSAVDENTEQAAEEPEEGCIASKGVVTVTRASWLTLLSDDPEKTRLNPGWTDVLSKAYSAVNPFCVLVFRSSYFGKRVSRVRKPRRLFRATAKCKHTGCIKVAFSLDKYPIEGDVKLDFLVTGQYNHTGEVHRRFVRGEEKQKMLEALKHLPPSAVKEQLMTSANKNVLKAGNHSSLPSLGTIQQIASLGRRKEERNSDVWRDLEAMCEENTAIRIFGRIPFMLAWHTKEQMQFLKSCEQRVLYLGCTGNFLREIFGRPVYYYALILQRRVGTQEIPIAEMVTDSTSFTQLRYWLQTVVTDMKEVVTSLDSENIVVDGSEALRDAAVWAFAEMGIMTYLKNRMKQEVVCPSIHVCGVQVTQAAMEAVAAMPHTLEGQQTAFKVVRAMSTKLNDALVIFRWASVVFSHRFVTPNVSNAIINLERAIARLSIDLDESETHKEVHIIDDDSFDVFAFKSKDSPYYEAFALSQPADVRGVTQYENALYIPGFSEYLLRTHLAYFPMWSAVGSGCRLADCVTEKWFRFVKTDILKRVRNVKPPRFFRLQTDLVAAMIRDACIEL